MNLLSFGDEAEEEEMEIEKITKVGLILIERETICSIAEVDSQGKIGPRCTF